MTFAWTPHRFSGGALALDIANTVILRFDAARRADRFVIPEQFDAFTGAAERLCAERQDFGGLSPVATEHTTAFMALREAIDAAFRHRIVHGRDDPMLLAELLEQIAATLRRHPAAPSPCPLDLATALSALRLLSAPEPERLKICPTCEWLFIDRSRNRSRTWCDMNVCGNRAKARLHYRRRKDGGQ